jgi:hypothetical protein
MSNTAASATRQDIQGRGNIVPARVADRTARLHIIFDQLQATAKMIKDAEGSALIMAMQAGDELLAHKHEVGHGGFLKYLDTHFKTKCSPRSATDYIKLAKGRALIEAEIGSAADLSIRGALRLLRTPKKAKAPKPTDVPAPAPDPYAPETLKELSAADRKRVIAALGVTMADVPLNIVAEIVQLERRAAEHRWKQVMQFTKKVCSAVMTNEAPAAMVKTIRAAVAIYEAKGARILDWTDRMDLAASRFTEATPKQSSPVPAALAHPPSDTKH